MKRNQIAAVLAVMGLSSSALALGPSSLPADYVIYAGGGSAQAQAVIYAADQLLTSIDSYSDGGCNGAQSGNYRIFFGTLKSAVGSAAAGSKVLLYYKFNGGSFPNGVQPQGLGSTLPYPSNVAGATACSGQSFPLPTYSIAGTPTVSAVPDWGLSDVETRLLNTVYNVPNAASSNVLTASQAANIVGTGVYDNIFGVAVSNNVYVSGTANGSCPKTNFSRTEMNGILGGTFTDWSQLKGDGGCSIAAGPIVLLDRAPGSGSKAAGNLYFLGYPNLGYVAPGNVAFGATGTRVACNGGYEDVNEGSSGNVVSDLKVANSSATTCRAVAVLGGEFPPALNDGGYSFTSVNNVDPGLNGAAGTSINYANEISGDYDFLFTNSFNYRTKQVGSDPQHWVGDGTAYASLITELQSIFKQPSIAGGSPSATATSPAGVLLDPKGAATLTNCMTRITRFDVSQAPAQLTAGVTDFSVSAPSCSDHL